MSFNTSTRTSSSGTKEGIINFNQNGTLNFATGYPSWVDMYSPITSTMTINVNASGDSKITGEINFGQQQTTINFSNTTTPKKLTIDMSNNNNSSQINGRTIVNFDNSSDTLEIIKNPMYGSNYTFQALQINLNRGAFGEKNTLIGDLVIDTMSSNGSSDNPFQSKVDFNQDNAYLLVDGRISSSVSTYPSTTDNTITLSGFQINFLNGNGTLEVKKDTTPPSPDYPYTQEAHEIDGAIINIGSTSSVAHATIISDFLYNNYNYSNYDNYIIFQGDGSSLSIDGNFGSINDRKNIIRLDNANQAYITSDLLGSYYSYNMPSSDRPRNIIEIANGKSLSLVNQSERKSVRGFNIVFLGEMGSFVGNLKGGVIVDFGANNSYTYPTNPVYGQNINFEGEITTEHGSNVFSFNPNYSGQMQSKQVTINSSSPLSFTHSNGYSNTFELSGIGSSSYGQNVTIDSDIYLNGTLSQNQYPPNSSYMREGNIFNLSSSSLTLGDYHTKKTLYTQSGFTQLNFGGNSAYFSGNVSTTGGMTQIILGYDGGSSYGASTRFSGNIQASDGGINQFVSNYSGALQIDGEISANDRGQNIFTRDSSSSSSSSKTFYDKLVFQASGSGKNIIEIYSGDSFYLKTFDPYNPYPSSIQNLGNIESKSGTTLINFIPSNYGGSTYFASNLIADGGNNQLDFQVSQDSNAYPNQQQIYFSSQLTANGENTNTFIFRQNTELQYDSNYNNYDNFAGTIIAGGTNTNGGNIFQIQNGVSLSISSYDSMRPSLHTIGGSTAINFMGKSGSFSGSILTSNGTTTLALLGGASSTISFNNGNSSLIAEGSGINKITFSGANSILDFQYSSSNPFQANDGGQNRVEISHQNTSFQVMGDAFLLNGNGYGGEGNVFSLDADNSNFRVFSNGTANSTSSLVVQSGVGKISFNANNSSMLSSFKVGSSVFSPTYPPNQNTLFQQGYVELNKESTSNTLQGLVVYFDKNNISQSYTLINNAFIDFNANQTTLNITEGISLEGGDLDINFNFNGSTLNSAFALSNDSALKIHLKSSDSHNTINQILTSENGAITLDTLGEGNSTSSNVTFESNGFESKTHTINLSFSGNGGTSTLMAENIIANGADINVSFSENGRIQGNLQALSQTNNIAFSRDGVIIGDITSKGGSNKFTLSGGAYSINGNITSSLGVNDFTFGNSGTLSFLGSREQSILASGNGKNYFHFNDTANTFVITTDVYAKSNQSGINLFEISGGKTLRFSSDTTLKSLITTLGKTTIAFSDVQSNRNASGNFVGNLIANGGNNEITFADDGVFGFEGSIEARNTSTNTFLINHNVTFSGDIETSTNSNGSNFFSILSGGVLKMGENSDKAIRTHSGTTTISLAQSSAIYGNVFADNGVNLIDFDTQTSQDFNARIQANLKAQISGKNIIKAKTTPITLTSDTPIELSGESLTTGFNQILFDTQNGTLNFTNIQGTALQTLKTTSGLTQIDFESASGELNANISTTAGTTTFNLGSLSATNTDTTKATLGGAISNDAVNIYNINSQNVVLKNGVNGLEFLSGENRINFANTIGATLDWQNSDGTTQAISSSGNSQTQINFANNGKILGGVSTNGASAITNINISQNKNGVIAGAISTKTGETNVALENNGTLTLQGATNTLTRVTSNINGTLALDGFGSANGVEARVENAIVGNSTTFSFNGVNGKKAEMTLASGGNEIKAIVFGNTANATTGNKLILSQGETTISTATKIIGGNAFSFELRDSANLTNTISNTGGEAKLEFNGSNAVFTGAISTTRGTTTLLIAEGKSGTITEAVTTTNGVTNIDFANGGGDKSLTLSKSGNTISNIIFEGGNSTNNTLTLNNGITTFSGGNPISIGENQSLNFDLADSTTLRFSNHFSNLGGEAFFSPKDNASSTISGNITSSNGGINNIALGNAGTLILQGADNALTNVGSITDGILKLDGASNSAGVSASVENAIIGDNTTLDFNGANGRRAEMTLAGDGNQIKAITLGSASIANTLILSTGSTEITNATTINTRQALVFDLRDGVNLTNNISNTGGSANLEFNGNNAIFTGVINTDGINALTTITVANGKNGAIAGNITTTSGITNINFVDGNNSSSLKLQREGNTITTITSGGNNNTLALDSLSNSVSAEVTNAISGVNSLTIALGGGLGNKAELTLHNIGGNSTIKAITSTNTSAVGENVLNLNANKTTITDNLSIASSKGLSINLAGDNVELTSGITTHGATNLNFNGNNAVFTGTIDTTGVNAITTIAIADNKNGTIIGDISLDDSGVNNTTIGENGILSLQGANNQLTSVSSNVNGTLSLDGASSVNGVEARVKNAIIDNNTTLNFNGMSGKKVRMTLASDGNQIKAITLGNGATNNTLILSQGETTISIDTRIVTNQALSFDLRDGVNLTNNISNTGGNVNLEFNGNNTIFTGTISTNKIGTTTTISIAEGSNGGITENVTTADGTTHIKFASGDRAKSLSLGGNNNTLTDIVFDLEANSTNNTLIFNSGKTEIFKESNITASSALTLNLENDDVELDGNIANSGILNLAFNGDNTILTGSISTNGGNTSINVAENNNATITGIISTTAGETNANLGNNGILTLQGATNKLTSVFSNTNGTLKLDGASNVLGVQANVLETIVGNKITIHFNSASGKKAELTLSKGGNEIKAITLENNSTANKLILSAETTSIKEKVNIAESQALTFDLSSGSSLSFITGLQTDGTTKFNLGGENNTLAGEIINNGEHHFNIIGNNTVLKYGEDGLAFSSGTNIINFANTNGAILDWKNSDGTIQSITTSGGDTQINFTNNGTISGGVSTSAGSTTLAISNGNTATIIGNISTSGGSTEINFNGESGTLASVIYTNGGTTSINISDNTTATITGNITTTTPSGFGARTIESASATNIAFKNNGTLILQGSTNQITTLTMGAGENILALTERGSEGQKERIARKVKIDNVVKNSNGSLKLISQITPTQADTFVIKGATDNLRGIQTEDLNGSISFKKGHIGLVFAEGVDSNQVGKDTPVLVASVAKTSGIEFEKASKFVDGFLIKEADFITTTTDENGNTTQNGDYTSYLVSSIVTDGIVEAEQSATASAFMLDYNLYMANLNSLNRRMGELRENAHSQGVWARVFNGGLSNDFGLGSKSNYTTIQAGYDYAFGSEGANNYLGFALSYALSFATSDSKATDSATGEIVGLDNIYSNAVEVALYNSYVSDSGWYNDTIAKFSYIMSSFDIQASGASSQSRASDTKNYALTLSDEIGYAIRFGEMSEWSITPQVEATFGYFSQSDFKQTLSNGSQYLDSKADSVLTLRARAGSAFTYDFRAFTQKSGFNASLYVGAFYEYDYVSGGDISMTVSDGTTETQKSDIGSDGRVVMNVGTNMTIQDNTRLYFDFEKSFAGKITTDYQVNFGVRYSFGESDGYTPILEKSDCKAPLKVEGEESKEGDKEVKEGEEKQNKDKVKEEEKKEDAQENPVENTQEKKAQKTKEETKNKTQESKKQDKKGD